MKIVIEKEKALNISRSLPVVIRVDTIPYELGDRVGSLKKRSSYHITITAYFETETSIKKKKATQRIYVLTSKVLRLFIKLPSVQRSAARCSLVCTCSCCKRIKRCNAQSRNDKRKKRNTN